MGWAGVDLFFVLSGFLITRILLETAGRPHYLRNFYARRPLRIFPIYYLWLLFLLVGAPQLSFFDRFVHWRLPDGVSSLWYWLYASNWLFAAQAAWLHPILSLTWSLAIEEQLYLLWPWVVRALSGPRLAWVCAMGVGLALLLRTVLVASDVSPIAVFVFTPCRFDGLLVGAFVALVSRTEAGEASLRWAARVALPATALALVAIVWASTGRPGERVELSMQPWMQTLGYGVIAVFFGSVVVLLRASTAAWARAFENPLLRTFGKYSYALYLTHSFVGGFFVLYVFNPFDQAPWLSLASYPFEWAAQLAVAAASSWLVERWFLQWKGRFVGERVPI